MVKLESGLDAIFGALSDPTRRAILERLGKGERSIGELAASFEMSFVGVWKHVQVLERAGLADVLPGRPRRCRPRPRTLDAAAAWLETHGRFWTDELTQVQRFLDRRHPPPPRRRR